MTQMLLLAQSGIDRTSLALAVLLLVLAFAFVVAEIFFVSFGVLTACSVGCFIGSFYLAHQGGGPVALGISIALALVLVPIIIGIGFKVMPRTSWGRKLILPNPDFKEVTASGVPGELEELVGKTGVTLTRCRPSGVAEIDDQRVDVVAQGMMIDVDRPVEVIEVEGTRVVIRSIEEASEEA